MSDLFHYLKTEFQDEDYRYAYAQSFLNTKLAAQIKTLREQRQMTQAQVATKMGIKQPGYRRFEDVNHSVWKTDSLWDVARAYGVRLSISFETFGTLPEEKARMSKESLRRPEFKDDPAFNEPSNTPNKEPLAALKGFDGKIFRIFGSMPTPNPEVGKLFDGMQQQNYRLSGSLPALAALGYTKHQEERPAPVPSASVSGQGSESPMPETTNSSLPGRGISRPHLFLVGGIGGLQKSSPSGANRREARKKRAARHSAAA